jgi:hypothetical protein
MAHFQCGKARQDASRLPPAQEANSIYALLSPSANQPIELKVFSAYLGEVTLKMDGEGDNLNLMANVNPCGKHNILIKVIDATTNRLRPLQMRYTESYLLQQCQPAKVNLATNRAHYLSLMTFDQAIARREGNKAKEDVAAYEIVQLQSDAQEVALAQNLHLQTKFSNLLSLSQLREARGRCLVELCSVDALFHMQEFLQFLHISTGEVGRVS